MPWASTASTSAGARPALVRACMITRSWEGPLGAVRPLEAPSWLTAEPRITARTRWPLRSASERRSSTSDPDALGEAGAVGGRRRRTCSARRAPGRAAGRTPGTARGGEHGDAAGEGERALARAQRLAGEVHRDQRGGAGGVDRDGRALEAEGVGDAAGDHAAGAAGAAVALESPRPTTADAARSRGTSRRRTRRSRLPRSDAGSIPALSSASQAVSSSSRCCGSIARASRGEMPKKPASKSAGVVRGSRRGGCRWCPGGRGRGRRGARGPSRGRRGTRRSRRDPSATSSPQVLGGGDAAGVAAGHADDRDRLVGRDARRRRARRGRRRRAGSSRSR